MLLAVVTVLKADPLQTIEKYLDSNCREKCIKRVSKLQATTYIYGLLTTHSIWTEYPGLVITSKVPFSQFVDVKYSVSAYSSNSCFQITRLIVDGT